MSACHAVNAASGSAAAWMWSMWHRFKPGYEIEIAFNSPEGSASVGIDLENDHEGGDQDKRQPKAGARGVNIPI